LHQNGCRLLFICSAYESQKTTALSSKTRDFDHIFDPKPPIEHATKGRIPDRKSFYMLKINTLHAILKVFCIAIKMPSFAPNPAISERLYMSTEGEQMQNRGCIKT
jgi:hypothetical protein